MPSSKPIFYTDLYKVVEIGTSWEYPPDTGDIVLENKSGQRLVFDHTQLDGVILGDKYVGKLVPYSPSVFSSD